MRNPILYYIVILIGIIGLIVGLYYQSTGGHQLRATTGIVVGVILLIVGIVGIFMTRSRGARP